MKKFTALSKVLTSAVIPVVVFLMLTCTSGCFSVQTPELFNVYWRPAGEAPEGVFLLFTPDRRRVVGCCGSNRFFGPAAFDGKGNVKIGMLGATRMASPHYKYEQKFMDDLQAAKSYRFDKNGDLILLDIDGEQCMRLKAVPAEKVGK